MKNSIFLYFLIFVPLISFSQKKGQPEKKNKSYNSIITSDAITDDGLFKVHKIDDKFYFEINPSHINREMLMVTRISKTLNGIGYGGQKINSQVLRWQKKNNKIL